MTQLKPQTWQAASTAAKRLADRHTPFVQEEWYVAAFSAEIGRALLRRTILGNAVVLYRRLDGTPVALSDRCIHRSFPLSAGTLDGDTVVCAYHGLRYNFKGDVIEVPSQSDCPSGLGVRSYPVLEVGPLIWIWTGRGPAGNSPHVGWLDDPNWTSSQGYFLLKANYIALHENLLDLSHLSFIHASSFGTPDYARTAFVLDQSGDSVVVTRHVVPTTLPPVWAETTGIGRTPTASRVTRSEFVSPGLHVVSGEFSDASNNAERIEYRIRTCHIVTPSDQTHTHYFIVHSRDFARSDSAVTAFMHDQLWAAFTEDVMALELMERSLGDEVPVEMCLASDYPGTIARRRIKERAMKEQSDSTSQENLSATAAQGI